MIHLIAEIKANPGCEQALESLLSELLEPTRDEEGCCQYELYADSSIPGLFLMQEIWCSQQSLDKHIASEHFTRFQKLSDEQQLVEYLQIRPLRFVG